MGEIELLAYIIKWRDEFSADIRVLKIDADIFVRPHAIRILLSLLLREGYLKICAACFQVAPIGLRRPVRMALTWQFTLAATLPRTIPFCCGYVFR